MKYNSKAVVGTIRDSENIFMQGYYKTEEFKYILKTDTKTAIESELVVGIKTPLNIIFITL